MKTDFSLPESSPAAPLAAALVQLGDALAEHGDLLPPGFSPAFVGAVASALQLLHVKHLTSANLTEDAIDTASGAAGE